MVIRDKKEEEEEEESWRVGSNSTGK